jgi:hypothetical protein
VGKAEGNSSGGFDGTNPFSGFEPCIQAVGMWKKASSLFPWEEANKKPPGGETERRVYLPLPPI